MLCKGLHKSSNRKRCRLSRMDCSVFQHYIVVNRISNNFLETLVNAFSTLTHTSGLQIGYKLLHHFFGNKFRFDTFLISLNGFEYL